jgi:hypothetical protein
MHPACRRLWSAVQGEAQSIEVNDVTCICGKTNVGLCDYHLIDQAVVDVSLHLERFSLCADTPITSFGRTR